MDKIKVMTVFGTRPEAIKMAPLVLELKKRDSFECIVAVTGQHREMLDQVLSLFGIVPDYDLNIMKQGQTLTDITTAVLSGIAEISEKEKPDIILVHGDTTTTFAASLAAFYTKTMIGHVEAGLRTGNKFEPFPEEINRKLTGVLTDIHFAPTYNAKNNLLIENTPAENIFITGNTVIDALSSTLDENFKFSVPELNDIDYKNKKVIAITAHRRENLGEPIENICMAIKKITENFPDTMAVYAVHKNPAVMEPVYRILGGLERVLLLPPLDLTDMHNLMNRSYFVMTDSGGLQEEVPSMGKPVLVLRNVTERPEGIEAGTLKLAGIEFENIYREAEILITDASEYNRMAKAENPFGDGHASERIADAIEYKFGLRAHKPLDFII